MAIRPGHDRSFLPTPTQGRLPRMPGEITLGARTLAEIHSHVGATVTVTLAGSRPARFKVVGAAVFPTLSDELGLGLGGILTVGGLRQFLPPGVPPPPGDSLLVRFRPQVGVQAGVDALAGRLTPRGPFSVSGPAIPTDLVNFGRVQDLPLLLGAALGLLALGTIVHLLLTAVRRRRRDFAILRVVGLTRGQVRATVGWQAATLASAALVIGVPAGVLLGRAAWRVFASQLGILPVVAVPPLTLAAMAAAALAVAAATAALPGESAARSAPATILRSE
jgi:putative ABC transport system permease protein